MVRGTRSEQLKQDIIQRKPTEMTQLIGIANDLVEIDELNRLKRRSDDREGGRRDETRRDGPRGSYSSRKFRGKTRFEYDGQPRPQLNAPLGQILLAIKQSPEKKNIKFPKVPEGQLVGPDREKYCEFHRARGHRTDDCKQLADEVYALIRAGKFSHFVKGVTKESTKRAKQEDDKDEEEQGGRKKPYKGQILVIAGGPSYEPPRKKTKRSGSIVHPYSDDLEINTPIERLPWSKRLMQIRL